LAAHRAQSGRVWQVLAIPYWIPQSTHDPYTQDWKSSPLPSRESFLLAFFAKTRIRGKLFDGVTEGDEAELSPFEFFALIILFRF
jgi:hypothetical protein